MPLSVKIFFHFEKKDQIDTTYITKKIPTDYLRILKLPKNCCTDSAVLLKKTVMSKFRNSISLFIYKKQYCIQIYKLTDHFNSSLINGIVEQASSSTVSYNQYYSLVADDNIDYFYLGYLPKKPKRITLNLYGKDTRKILENDTILDYYSLMENFSIRYDKENSLDICGNTKNDSVTPPENRTA